MAAILGVSFFGGLVTGCERAKQNETQSVASTSAPSSDADIVVLTVDTLRGIDPLLLELLDEKLFGVLSSSRFVLFDDRSGSVFSLSDAGDTLQTFGSRGRGPGEFTSPTGLGLSLEGELAVFDAAKQALVRFTKDGQVLPELAVNGTHSGAPLGHVAGNWILWLTQLQRSPLGLSKRLVAVNSIGTLSEYTSSVQPVPKTYSIGSCPYPVPLGPLLAAKAVWRSNGNRIAFAQGERYAVSMIDDRGRQHEIFARDVPLRAVRAMDLEDAVAASPPHARAARDCGVSASAIAQQVGHAATFPAVTKIALSPSGTIWIDRDLKEGLGLDVIGQRGEFVGRLQERKLFPLAFINDSTFFAVVSQEGGEKLLLRVHVQCPCN